jgi:hypothetical protein
MPKSVNANSQVNSNNHAYDGEAEEMILHQGANATENLDVVIGRGILAGKYLAEYRDSLK